MDWILTIRLVRPNGDIIFDCQYHAGFAWPAINISPDGSTWVPGCSLPVMPPFQIQLAFLPQGDGADKPLLVPGE